MTAPRQPIDRLIDLAVAVPSCALVAARRAVPLAARIGVAGTVRVVERVSTAVHELRPDADETTDELIEHAEEPVADAGVPESVPASDLPIEGYDDLAARQVVDRLAALDAADLARIEIYEREHRNRSTVLGKIAMLTA